MDRKTEKTPSPTPAGTELKVSRPGADIRSKVETANARVSALADEYEAQVRMDLANAEQALKAAGATPEARPAELEKISRIAHDMRGQGSAFGYDLITLVAGSLCDFLRRISDAGDDHLAAIEKHLSFVAVILDNHIKGPGGAFADKIAAKLEQITAATQGG